MWSAPAYAPRGDGIVFGRARSPYVSQTSGYDLYVMDRDGSDRRQVFPASDELGLEYPEVAWGPDGDQVVVVYQGNLNLVSIADGAAQPLTNQGNATSVRWQW
jgi:Tol biopolymer transport system component